MLRVLITGTFNELLQLYELMDLCSILGIDPYKLCMVDTDAEEFTITETQLLAHFQVSETGGHNVSIR